MKTFVSKGRKLNAILALTLKGRLDLTKQYNTTV